MAARATISGGPFTTLFHVHGALFTGWVALFIAQTALISTRRVALHRKVGVAGAVLAVAMVIVGVFAGIELARRGGAPPGIDPLSFLAIPLFDMLMFASFVATALARIASPDPAAAPYGGSRWTERSAAPRKSARLQSDPDDHRCSRPSLCSAVEHRLGKIRGRRFQDLVRPLQFEVFAFELLEPRAFISRQARTLAGISFRLAHPLTQRFRADPKFVADRSNRRPLR
jgi:hypothetical protein